MNQLIPRTLLFGNPDRAAARISPDGAWLSYLAPSDGVLNIWLAPYDQPDAAKPITADAGRGIRSQQWAADSSHIVYLQDAGGDENWHVHAVNIQSGESRDLTPIDGVAARIEAVSHTNPNAVVVGINDRNPQLHDPVRIDLATGQRTRLAENPGFAGMIVDADYQVRLAIQMAPDGGINVLERANDEWKLLAAAPQEDALTTGPVHITADGQTLYMIDSRGRDTAALVACDLTTGSWSTVAENPRADISRVMADPQTLVVQAACATYDRAQWQVFDDGLAADLERLHAAVGGDTREQEVDVVSRSLDDARWIVALISDVGPVRYYTFEKATGQAKFLFSNRTELDDVELQPMQPVVIKARDGLDLPCYFTRPPAIDAPPMVLLVHGGPWARDHWGLEPHHQWLANRGYAVLSVNFRGSTGFGKSFINAGNLQWAGSMHDDLLDAVEWAVETQGVDRQRIAIMGGSYGGYATLAGLTFTPEVFACGVDIVGPSNLITLLETIPPYWEPLIAVFTTRVGDHRTEAGRAFLRERSPLTHVDNICRPLLIAQGANDPRVKQAESDQIVDAMQAKGIPVTYVLYPDEGHGFARPENRLSFYATVEAFLGRHLGGAREPFGSAFEGASIQVPAGRAEVEGLADALASLP